MKQTVFRLLSLLLCLVMFFSLTACAIKEGSDGENGNPSNPTNNTPPKEPEIIPQDSPYVPSNQPVAAEDRQVYSLPDDHGVLGEGIGVKPGRVVWEHDNTAFSWNGYNYWWLEQNFNTASIYKMVEDGLCSLTGAQDTESAWNLLFANFNWRQNGESRTYKGGEKIAIKTNMNCCSAGTAATSNNTQGLFATPVLLRALLISLVEYGVAPSDITVFDASRTIPTYLQDMCSEGILDGINFEYYVQGGGKNDAKADTTRPIDWSYDFSADPTFYPTCVTEATYMINFSNLKGHGMAGITVSGKNHFGTVMPGVSDGNGGYLFDHSHRANPPTYAGLHPFVATHDYDEGPGWQFPRWDMGNYSVLTDLLSNADCGGKTFLYFVDALAVTPMQNAPLTTADTWITFDNNWTNSIFLSQDPVAIDSVCYDFMMAECAAGNAALQAVFPAGNSAQNYLHESALAYDPPSGTAYHDGYGNLISSLGVHEHWNNPTDKQYSRNLGEDEGIELIRRQH